MSATIPPLPSAGNPPRNPLVTLLASPILIGTLLSFGFYYALPFLPVDQGLAQRYFCGHWIEYATTGLFFIGMMILVQKVVRLPGESKALASDPLVRLTLPGKEQQETLGRIQSELAHVSRRQLRSVLVERILDVAGWLRGRSNANGVEDYLKYRAEVGLERLHESYSLVRTITWAIPILGFLGTVIGITMAIANLNPEQLATSLDTVTGGLAVAFDTTALSLALSLVIVFASFLAERAEQRILGRVEEYGLRRLAPLFPETVDDSARTPMSGFADAEAKAAAQLLEKTESLITRQSNAWEEAVEAMRERWAVSLDLQGKSLDTALQQGIAASLESHSEQLGLARDEFLTAFEKASTSLQTGVTASVEQQKAAHADFCGRFDTAIRTTADSLGTLQQNERERVDELIGTINARVGEWLDRMHVESETNRELTGELRRHAEILLQVAAQEEELNRLQTRLNENLETLRASQNFEETVHSLSAAVHLLTARTMPRAA